MPDSQENSEVAVLLKSLILVSQQGYDTLRKELVDLRLEMKEMNKEQHDRLSRLEQFMFQTQGGLAITRILAGASFLGAVISIAAAYSMR